MSEMVELVARAIRACDKEDVPDEIIASHTDLNDIRFARAFFTARAAIAAMRECSHDAFWGCDLVTGRDSEGVGIAHWQAKKIWEWRIDKALEE